MGCRSRLGSRLGVVTVLLVVEVAAALALPRRCWAINSGSGRVLLETSEALSQSDEPLTESMRPRRVVAASRL